MEELLSENTDSISTIVQVINQIVSNLLTSIDKNIFPLLDELVFIDKDIISTGDKMNQLLSNSPTSGVLILANSLFTAFVLYYAARLILSPLSRTSNRVSCQILYPCISNRCCNEFFTFALHFSC